MSWNLLAVIAHIKWNVECLNSTFGVMAWSLLYSSGVSPQYWIAAPVHDVHLRIWLWHSALDDIPFVAWNSTQLDHSPIGMFWLIIDSKIPFHYTAKLNKHAYDGFFLSYEGSLCNNGMYLDVHSDQDKDCGHFNFDEAHYTSIFVCLVHCYFTLVFIQKFLFTQLVLILLYLHLVHSFQQ